MHFTLLPVLYFLPLLPAPLLILISSSAAHDVLLSIGYFYLGLFVGSASLIEGFVCSQSLIPLIGLEKAAAYWHLVDVVWLALFLLFYCW
jgi:hypothetical protein